MYRVTTPVAGYTGISAGVNFTNGVAEVEEGPALNYFRGAGYGVEETTETGSVDEPDIEAPPPGPEMPKKSASTEAWRTYAVDSGQMTEEQAAELTRDGLVELLYTEENPS